MLKVFNKPNYPVENKPTWWRLLREPGENINFTGSVTGEWSFSLTPFKTSTNQRQIITPAWAEVMKYLMEGSKLVHTIENGLNSFMVFLEMDTIQ